MFCKKGALKNFTKFTGKHLCQSLFFNKVAGLRLWQMCFPVNFATFLRTTTFIEHVWWLLLLIWPYTQTNHKQVQEHLSVAGYTWRHPNKRSSLKCCFHLVDIFMQKLQDYTNTAQKMKFSIKDFFNKCDQTRRKLRIWSQLLMKSLTKNFIFCGVYISSGDTAD